MVACRELVCGREREGCSTQLTAHTATGVKRSERPDDSRGGGGWERPDWRVHMLDDVALQVSVRPSAIWLVVGQL